MIVERLRFLSSRKSKRGSFLGFYVGEIGARD